MSERTFPYYPLFLDTSGRRCVVVGGGHVAFRKVKPLLECGASVTVVSPEVCSEMQDLAEAHGVRLVLRGYQVEDLAGALVVIAATDDPVVNSRVSEEARGRGVLVNVVDDMHESTFIAPSYLRRGNLTVAISTGGRSPALARRIREKLEAELGEEYSHLSELLGEVRDEMKRRGTSASGEVWQQAIALETLLDLLRQDREGEAKTLIMERLGVPAKAGGA